MLSFTIYHNSFLAEFEKLSLQNLLPIDPITEHKSRAEQQALFSMSHCSRKLFLAAADLQESRILQCPTVCI